jgi:hypothetical protein
MAILESFMRGFAFFCWCFPFTNEIEKLGELVLAVWALMMARNCSEKASMGSENPSRTRFYGVNINASMGSSFDFASKMSKVDIQVLIFYSKTMESYLSIIIGNHGHCIYWRKLNGKVSQVRNDGFDSEEEVDHGWTTRQGWKESSA